MNDHPMIDFILARIAERETMARAATAGPWDAVEGLSGAWWVELRNLGDVALDLHGENARHIAAHDPARVLAQCAAYRAIVRQAIPKAWTDEGEPLGGGYVEGWWDTLRTLTAIWADHEDYREEWRLA